MISENPRIGFIGFGEVAYHFSKRLKEERVSGIVAYDKAISEQEPGELIRERASDAGVQLTKTLEELLARSELVISSVWGHVALEVAKEAARFIKPDRVFADLNNSAPSAKKEGAQAINAAGAKYADIALFGLPYKSGQKALMLASGDGADPLKAILGQYNMVEVQVVPAEAGRATTIKALAKIYYLGFQALSLELALSARTAGVALEVIEPLLVRPTAALPREKELAFWLIRGGLQAERKSAEIHENLEAMKEWGMEPIMMEAAMKRFHLAAQYKLKEYFRGELPPVEEHQKILDAIDKIGREKKIGLR
jgi:3-hydroxyisobutyrate dehydrogenase-like beta-hydroxyacid dehydrogenase